MKRSSFKNLIILSLITMFLGGSGFVVLYGAQFYTKMVKDNEISLNRHSALLYFNNRIKQHDGQDQITVITQGSIQALCFKQDDYFTLVYEVDGYLVEQSSESATIQPLEAQRILPLSKLSFVLQVHKIIIQYTSSEGVINQLSYTVLAVGPSS
jgi:hypothetical protein